MNSFAQGFSEQTGVWACVAFGVGVLLGLRGVFGGEGARGGRRRRVRVGGAVVSRVIVEVLGEEGTWRWKIFAGLFCVWFVLPVRPFFWALLVLILPLVLGVVVAVVGASYLFYREVAWRALRRREPEAAGMLSWGVGLRLMGRRVGGRRGVG